MSATLTRVFPDVVSMLADAAATSPDAEAIVCGEVRLNYRQYYTAVNAFAQELQTLGVKNERVALLLRNSADLCIAMFAAHQAGAQVVPLNPRYTEHELTGLLQQAEVKILIGEADNDQRDTRMADAHNISHHIKIGSAERLLTTLADVTVEDIFELPLSNQLAMLQFTGGTTGIPKGVNVTHNALALNVAQREAVVPTNLDRERILCVMPLYHCYAIHMCMHNMVNCRGTLIIQEPYSAESVLDLIEKEAITIFGGSPTLFNDLLAYGGIEQADFSTLKITYSGSAPLSQDLLQRWESLTTSIVIEGYGQTEAGPVISFNPIKGVRKLSSVGIALPETDLAIVDNHGTSLPVGECGEICVRGPQIMAGYLDRPEETANAIRDGWLHTGDMGELDSDGYLFIRGRLKEMIIVSGFNVYPNEVEDVLATHAEVLEAAVVARDDQHSGQLPVAFVVTTTPLESTDLQSYCRQYLAAYKVPVVFNKVDSLPKTAVGKIDKVAVSKLINEF